MDWTGDKLTELIQDQIHIHPAQMLCEGVAQEESSAWPRGVLGHGVEVFERLGEAGLGEEVMEAGREVVAQARVLGGEAFGDILERREVRGGIAVPEGVVGDDVEALLEQVSELEERGGHAVNHQVSHLGGVAGARRRVNSPLGALV